MVLVGIYLASLFLAGRVACVVFSERGDDDYDQTFAVSSMAKSCLAGADPLLSCFNERAMAALERAETMETVRLDAGLELARRPGPEGVAPRGVYSFGKLRLGVRFRKRTRISISRDGFSGYTLIEESVNTPGKRYFLPSF